MRLYGVLCLVFGIAGIVGRSRLSRWYGRLGLPGDTPTNVYWGRVVLPSVLLILLGAAMAVTG